MRSISVISKLTGVTNNLEASEITLNAPSIVQLKAERADIASTVRSSQDMIVTLRDGEAITVKNFYDFAGQGGNQLVLEDSSGALWWVQDTSGSFHFESIANIEELMAATGAESEGGAIWPWVLGGLAVAGGIGIAAANGGGGGGDDDSDNGGGVGGEPGGGNGGEPGSPVPPGGSTPPDTTPPTAPGNLAVSGDGKTVTGTAEPGSTVTVKDANGSVIGTGTAGSDGSFTIPVTTPQIGGEKLDVSATDPAGNTGPSAEVTAPTIPLPGTPEIASIIDDVAPIAGIAANNQQTDDNTPTLQGSGTAGSVIHIYDNGTEIGTAIVNAQGNWNFTPGSALADGSHAFTTVAVNARGESSPSASYTIVVDTAAPDAPDVAPLFDNVGSIKGAIGTDGATDESKPVLSGKGEPGNTVTLYDNDVIIATTTVDNNGNWTYTPAGPLADGTHSITLTQTDPAGNVSGKTTLPTFTIDTTPPAAATNLTTTLDGTAVTGTAEPGSTVTIKDGTGTTIGEGITADDGSFTVPIAPPQTNGETLDVTATDKAGNTGPAAEVTAPDTTAPATPATPDILAVFDNVESVTGPVTSGQTTNDDMPEIRGTAAVGSIVSIYDNGTLLTTITIDNTGAWSFTPDTALGQGLHNLTVTASDADGNASPPASFSFIVDSVLPLAATITHISDNVGILTGTITNNGVTNDPTPTISGTGEPNTLVSLYDGDTLLTTLTVDDSGTWSYTPANSADGVHNYSVTASDTTGNTTPRSDIYTITVDTSIPATPAFTDTLDDVGTVTTPLINGGITDDTRPQFNGTGATGSIITLYDGTTAIGTATVDDTGNWTITPVLPLSEGAHSLTAVASDAAGNVSPAASFALTVDTTPPGAPQILAALGDVSDTPTQVINGGSTQSSNPVLSGTGETGATIEIFNNGLSLGTTTVLADGTWTLPLTEALDQGSHTLTAVATDIAGNVGIPSAGFTLIVDSVAPATPGIPTIVDDLAPGLGNVAPGGSTNDTTPTFTGIDGTPGDTITVYDNDKTVLGTTTVRADGTWSVTPEEPLGEATYSITVYASDPAGNLSAASSPVIFTIDTEAPDAPVINNFDDNAGNATGPMASGSITDDNTPIIQGSGGVPGDTITVYNGTTVIGTTTVQPRGSWTLTPDPALPDGTYALTATATDPAGNVSPVSNTFDMTVYTTPLSVPVLTGAVDDDVPTELIQLFNGDFTNDNTPTLSGTGTVGSTITLYEGDGATARGSAVVGADGTWTITTPVLTNGPHFLQMGATDAAGNEIAPVDTIIIRIDRTPPAPPVVNTPTDPTGTLISGTAEAGSTIIIKDALGNILGSALTEGTPAPGAFGNWTVTIFPAQTTGGALTAIAVDYVGNPSNPAAFTAIISDLPQPPVIDSVADDVGAASGNIASGKSTDDTLPVLSGSGAAANAAVNIYVDGALLTTVAADASGSWNYPLTAPLGEGPHTFAVSQTTGGLTSGQSPLYTITVDTTAPTVPAFTSVIDDVTPGTGNVDTGQPSNDPRPTLNGTGEAGSTITIFSNGDELGTAVVNTDGTWSFTPTANLNDGPHTLTISATDAAGNVTAGTNSFNAIIDTTPPAAPVIGLVFDNNPSSEPVISGQPTNDNTPAFSGSAEPNTILTVRDNGTIIGTANVNGTGNWRFTLDSPLTDGSHNITFTATDAAGNEGPESTSFNVVVDTVPPVVPTITLVTEDQTVIGTDTPLANGQLTRDSQPTLNGTSEANATLTVMEGTTVIGTTTADASGNWSFTPTLPLGQGDISLTVTATDVAGNTSNPSSAFTIVVDTVAPTPPAIVTVTDNTAPSTGPVTSGTATNETRPALTGTGEVGATITVYNDGTAIGTTTVGAGGTWSFTPANAITDGSHSLTVTATDTAGNISAPSAGFTLVVDTAIPVAPAIVTVADDVGAVTGNLTSGQTTDDATPVLTGTAEANTTVNIYDNGTLIGSAPTDGTGAWTFTPGTALGNGSHALTVTTTDAAGNISPVSGTFALIVDTQAPTSPVVIQAFDDVAPGTGALVSGQNTNDEQPLLSGTAEANATVTLYDNGILLGTTTADATGAWSFTPANPLDEGNNIFTATSTDKAGNVGEISGNFTLYIDSVSPPQPELVTVVDDVAGGVVNAPLTNGQTTNDARPTLNGTGETESTISIYDGTTLLGTTTVVNGTWAFTPTTPLSEGNHSFTMTATDAAGNTSATSLPSVIVVDTQPPGAPTAVISADGTTVNGIAEANSTVTITLPGGVTATATADASGAYSITLPTRQIGGEVLTVNATDAAGNTSLPSTVTAPDLPLVAGNNVVDLALTTDAEVTSAHYSDYGVLLIGALGNVASVLGNDTAQVGFTIADGGSGNVTIDAAATGIVLTLLNTLEVAVQKYDAATDSWSTIIDSSMPQFANLLTLGTSGVTLNIEGLAGGNYRVLSYNTSLLATGSLTSLDVDVVQTSAGTITGNTTVPGNVITDIDPTDGQDIAPTGTLVTSVAFAQGQSVVVGAGGADIQGQYGTLHINQDGSYTYTLTSTSPSVIGRTENFTYTITHNGVSDSAQLVVTLGNPLPASTVTPTDNTAALTYSTDVEAIDHGPSEQSGFSVIGVALGNLLSLDVLADMTDPIIFNVEDGSTRTLTLQASAGGIALLSTFDLYIYKFNDITQQFEQYQMEENWLTVPLLGGQSEELTLTLPGGEYLFLLNTASGVAVLTGYTLDILQDHTYAVETVSATTTGNILSDDIAPVGSHVTLVNGVSVASSGTTTINGEYGTLTIDADGSYTYTLNAGQGADSIKTPDSFVYTVTAPNGDTGTASLNITATPQPVNAVDDASTLMTVATAQNTAAYSDTTVGSAVWNAALLASTSGNGSGTFVVDSNSVLQNPQLNFGVASLLSLGGLTVDWTLAGPSGVVTSGTFNGSNLLLGSMARVDLSGLALQAGTYTLSYTGRMGPLGLGQITITPSVTGTTLDLDSYSTLSGSTVQGNLYDGTDASGAADQLSTVDTLMTVTGFNGSTATLDPLSGSDSLATIQGQYGTLQIGLDGAYTYTLNSGISPATITTKETFNYTLNDQNGHSDSATLTINMNPQFMSSKHNDVITGSAYGDTLVYDLLNATSATGGNGADTWKNFSMTQGDKIDIGDLLTGWNGQSSTLGNYLNVTTIGNNTVISVDRDGTGTTYSSTNIVTLENVQTTLDELVQQNHIVT